MHLRCMSLLNVRLRSLQIRHERPKLTVPDCR